MDIIYSKFSNDRRDEYAIVTNILKDVDGNRYIEKLAAKQAGQQHIDNLSVWETKLREEYRGTGIRPNEMVEKNGKKYFRYVHGTALDAVLDQYLKNDDVDTVVSILGRYINLIARVHDDIDFEMTEEFRTVFGEVVFPDRMRCAGVTNIDMVTENLMICGKGSEDIFENDCQMIDYEWTFDFPIPAHFVIYRILHYYMETKAERAVLKGMNLYEKFGLSTRELALYREMEAHFQSYILGDMKPLWMMHDDIVKPAVSMASMEDNLKYDEKRVNMEVFYDFGEGIKPESCVSYQRTVGPDGFVTVRIPVRNARVIRLDPSSKPCITIIRDVKGLYVPRGSYPIAYRTNASLEKNGACIFGFDDAQIYFENIRENTQEVEVTLSVLSDNFDTRINVFTERAGISPNRNYDELEHHYLTAMALKAERERQIQELTERAMTAEWKLHCIYRTIPYKLTKPFRMLYTWSKRVLVGTPKKRLRFDTFKLYLKGQGKQAKAFYAEQFVARRTLHLQDKIDRLVTPETLAREAAETVDGDIKFSILVPVYNTPEEYLMQMIESVLAQSYGNYQLCIADGSDKKHKNVGRICKGYTDYDSRVCYRKLKKNGGIADNTNAAWDMADGDYIILFDHDDLLHPEALYEVYKAVKETGAEYIYTDEMVFYNKYMTDVIYHLKPDFSPDYLRGLNYICHLSAFSSKLAERVGRFRPECDGSQDYDMALRLSEKANMVYHLPKVLYFWRSHPGSVASGIEAKTYCLDSAKKALRDHLERIGMAGTVEDSEFASAYRIRYEIIGEPMISILIPNKDHIDELAVCVDSIFGKSSYRNFEIIIIENGSEETATFEYYDELRSRHGEQIRVVTWTAGFNYAAINNFGARHAKGEYLLLLNNDTEVITPDWLQEMLMFAQREDVGVVGPLMFYGDDTIQHAGLVIGLGGTAGHSHKGLPRYIDGKPNAGYLCKLAVAQDVYGVTGACMMISKSKYDKMGGLDEAFVVAFNDVDFCCRLMKAGYYNVFTPFAQLYHYESKSRGYEDTPEKKARFARETKLLLERHGKEIAEGDPFYSPMLTTDTEDYAMRRDYSVFIN